MRWLVLCTAAVALQGFLRADRAVEGAGARSTVRMRLQMHTTARGEGPAGKILYGSLKIGTPPQEFLMAIDTSSGNVVVPSKACLSQACMSHRYFDVELSASGHPLSTLDNLQGSGKPERITLGFAKGQLTGTFAHDQVCLGQMCTALDFVTADTMSDEPFNLVPFDGILGLGMPYMSVQPSFNLMGELAEDNALKHNQYAIWLARDGDGEDSELVFGDMNPERLGSQLLWLPITTHPGTPPSGFWQISLADVSVNNEKLSFCKGGGCQAVADSSTTAIGLPKELYETLTKQAPVREDCSGADALPLIGFVIDGYVLNLRPQDYVVRTPDGSSCSSVLYPLTIPPPKGPLILLGVPFLTAFYSVYDRETQKLGLALASHHDVTTDEALKLFVQLPQ